jgi:hypothetical protein
MAPAPREELVRGNAMSGLTVMPGSNVSSTIRTFSDAVQLEFFWLIRMHHVDLLAEAASRI